MDKLERRNSNSNSLGVASVTLNKAPVQNIFALLGVTENSLTKGLGWALGHSSDFRERFFSKINFGSDGENIDLRLQHPHPGYGTTDIEIVRTNKKDIVLIEAKIDFKRPSHIEIQEQLEKYIEAIKADEEGLKLKHLILLTAYPEDVSYLLEYDLQEHEKHEFPIVRRKKRKGKPRKRIKISDVKIDFLSWETISALAMKSAKLTSGDNSDLVCDFSKHVTHVLSKSKLPDDTAYILKLDKRKLPGTKLSPEKIFYEQGVFVCPCDGPMKESNPTNIGLRDDRNLLGVWAFPRRPKATKLLKGKIEGAEGATGGPYYIFRVDEASEIVGTKPLGTKKRLNNHRHFSVKSLSECASLSEVLKQS